LCQVVGERFSFWRTGVSGEVRNAGDDAAAPVVHDLLGLVREHFASEFQVALVFVGKSHADFQVFEFLHRDGRHGNFGRSVGVSGDVFGDFSHETILTSRSDKADGRLPSYSPALDANVATTAMFCSRSLGKLCRSSRYSVLL